MQAVTEQLIQELALDVVERIDLEGRPEERLPIPVALLTGPLGRFLRSRYPTSTLWRHQALALTNLLEGGNVVVATGTASGKSLIFQLYALHLISCDPEARVLVYYPLKALAADQFERWKALCRELGLSSSAVAKIDGEVLPTERDAAMERASIILMTPDVCQAWFMRNVGSSAMRRFLTRLRLLVLDEAHVYESVFGSNVAFLLRRLISSKRHISRTLSDSNDVQIVAATATIADPAVHLERLAGRPFIAVEDDNNGAPAYPRTLLHVNGAEWGAAGELAIGGILRGVLSLSERKRFIAFVDSRQGTERVVRQIGSDSVMPYRSGYEAADRARIECALREGTLHGVVSTSALELGIDIPDMEIGINLGVPDTRKSFRQRIGRVGRTGRGLFIIIAGPNAFRQFGQTFLEYFQGSVEASYLYTGNRFIQFAHARCLWDEMEVTRQDRSGPPPGVDWPEPFEQVLRYARPGGGRPREFDYMAQLGADSPHLNYPLRQVGEADYELKLGRSDFNTRIGNIALHQALREAYPGANYLHLGQSYKVLEWLASRYGRSIRLECAHSHAPTRPLLRKTVNVALDQGSVIEGRIKRCRNGLFAETNLQVNESVEGYRIGSSTYAYRDLRAENPNMSRKQRDFRTTGAVILIDELWFAGSSGEAPANREAFGRALIGVLGRERSISPHDIDFASTNIALLTEQGPKRVTNCVVIYDVVYGGIRLTEDLFDRFEEYMLQISRAATLSGSDAIVTETLAERIEAWASTLEEGQADDLADFGVPDGWYQVYKPGSMVSIYHNGHLVSRELVTPRLIDPLGEGSPSVFYSYKVSGRQSIVPHEQIHPLGDDWSYVLWNPETNEIRELETDHVAACNNNANSQWLKVYRPGTGIMVMVNGRAVQREIVEVSLSKDDSGSGEHVAYAYKENGGRGYVPHHCVQPTGSDWSLVFWNPQTNAFRELDVA